jgi:hypothetical protein
VQTLKASQGFAQEEVQQNSDSDAKEPDRIVALALLDARSARFDAQRLHGLDGAVDAQNLSGRCRDALPLGEEVDQQQNEEFRPGSTQVRNRIEQRQVRSANRAIADPCKERALLTPRYAEFAKRTYTTHTKLCCDSHTCDTDIMVDANDAAKYTISTAPKYIVVISPTGNM